MYLNHDSQEGRHHQRNEQDVTVAIPVWILWTIGLAIGIPLILAVCFCAAVGLLFMWNWR